MNLFMIQTIKNWFEERDGKFETVGHLNIRLKKAGLDLDQIAVQAGIPLRDENCHSHEQYFRGVEIDHMGIYGTFYTRSMISDIDRSRVSTNGQYKPGPKERHPFSVRLSDLSESAA